MGESFTLLCSFVIVQLPFTASGIGLHAPHRDETEEFLDESYRACQATAARPDAALHCSDGEVGSDSESESVLPASSCNRACVRVRVACVASRRPSSPECAFSIGIKENEESKKHAMSICEPVTK